jgi:hypothetical protein
LSFYVVVMAEESIMMTLRLSQQEVEFLDLLAGSLCNTRAGVVRYAIKNLRTASGDHQPVVPLEAATQREEAAA